MQFALTHDPLAAVRSPRRNHLLAVLPEPVSRRLLQHLDEVPLVPSFSVYEDDAPIQHFAALHPGMART